jgi:hypothetical protein
MGPHPVPPPLEVPVANPRWEQVVGGANPPSLMYFKWQDSLHQLLIPTLDLLQGLPVVEGLDGGPISFQKFSRFSLLVAKFRAWTPLILVTTSAKSFFQQNFNLNWAQVQCGQESLILFPLRRRMCWPAFEKYFGSLVVIHSKDLANLAPKFYLVHGIQHLWNTTHYSRNAS